MTACRTARYTVTVTFAAAVAFGACTANEPEWTTETEETTVAVVESLAAVAAIAGPTSGADLGGDTKAEGDQETVEHEVTTEWVVDPSCVHTAWQGLSLTAEFDGCVLAATGETLDGSITAALSFVPTTLSVTFDALAVGEHDFDGSVGLVFEGDAPAIRTTLAIDMRYTGSDTTLDLDQVSVAADPVTASVTLDGSGVVSSGDASFAARADTLTWAAGECLASSGDIVVDQGAGPITVTFLATTPGDGVVTIHVGSLPTFDQQLFVPCP